MNTAYNANPNINREQYKSLMNKQECNVPYLSRSAVRTIDDRFNIMVCLPPKCGTTNWQRGMNVLQSLLEGERTEPEDFKPPKLYNLLPILNMRKAKAKDSPFLRQRSISHKIANTRNPFSRLITIDGHLTGIVKLLTMVRCPLAV